MDYRQSGVDIDAGNETVKRMFPLEIPNASQLIVNRQSTFTGDQLASEIRVLPSGRTYAVARICG